MISDSEIVMEGKEMTASVVQKLQDFINDSSDERIIKTNKGTAEVYVENNSVSITSKGHNGIVVSEYGTTIDGNIHLAPDPNNVRISGFWTLNNELLTTLPSTIYTPIPVLVYDEPQAIKVVQGLVNYLSNL